MLCSTLLLRLVVLACAGLICSYESSAADAPDVHGAEPAIKLAVSSDLVQVPVTVTDKLDRVVSYLDKNTFRVYENGVEQEIAHFAFEDAPISVCLVLDASLSMADKLPKAREAVNEFLTSATEDDEFCVVRVNDRSVVTLPLTSHREEVVEAMNQMRAWGFTALLDGIYLGIEELRHGHNRHKALVVLSDGGDNRSRRTSRDIVQLVKEADVQIYSIGIFSPEDQSPAPEQIEGPALLKRISEHSGGHLYRIRDVEDLSNAAQKISTALRHQYVLGYYPKSGRDDGKYHRLRVKIKAPKGVDGLRAYWREGYYAPTKSGEKSF